MERTKYSESVLEQKMLPKKRNCLSSLKPIETP